MSKLYLMLLLCISFIACANENTTKDRKEATEFTKKVNQELNDYLPMDNDTDFENATKGFIGNSDDNMSFSFISNQMAPDTVNPSLWRQSQLNNYSGLFEVVPGIYQVRGFDLANITFIKGNTGWIVVDPLTSKQAAEKALALFREYKGDAPITGVIYTHSHADHFSGVKGIITEDDVKNGVPVVAPEGFFEEAVSENLMAGNAMSRRASYMYGNLLPKDEKGTVDAGLGKGVSVGDITIIEPTDIISVTGETFTIDGVLFEFLMAQNTEAPAEFLFYIPKYKVASSAEVMNHTLHNLSTLRGAKTREALTWANAIKESKEFLAGRTDVLFGSHHWPTWGQANIDDFLSKHGDLYKYIHDQTLRYANMGYTLVEIPEMITLPDSLGKEFYNRGYYGTVNHDVKAVYDYYFGAWWDGNPANLYRLPPTEAAKRYVEFMGGEKKTIKMAKKYYNKGEYRWVVEVLNHVIFANPKNQEARNLSADAMEQLGYQSESAPWRAYFLTGALELRNGVVEAPVPQTGSSDMAAALPIPQLLDYLGVRLNAEKARNVDMSINLTIGNEMYNIILENSVLKYTDNHSDNSDLDISMSRAEFNQLLLKKITIEELLENNPDTISNMENFVIFMSLMDNFNFWFNIIEP